MAYISPQNRIFQELTVTPPAGQNPQSTLLVGGNAQLVRYSSPAERQLGLLGFYDAIGTSVFEWPNRVAGALVDLSYTKLTIENALLRWATATAASFDSTSISFADPVATNAAANRGSAFLSRDVQRGDVVKISGSVGGETEELWTRVLGVTPDVAPAVIGAPVSDLANPLAISTPLTTVVAGSGNTGDINFSSADISNWDPLVTGILTESYTITTVISGNEVSARFDIISSTGLDNRLNVAMVDGKLPLGNYGALLVPSKAIGEDDEFAIGDSWSATIRKIYTPAVAASGGSYNRRTSVQYIIDVVSGGTFAKNPQILVTSADGRERSGPHVVSALSSPVAIGSSGVTFSLFSGVGLRKGDRYYIEVSGVSDGPIRTVRLQNSLSPSLLTAASIACNFHLVVSELNVPMSDLSWEANELEISVYGGIQSTHPTVTDGFGEAVNLEVLSADILGAGKLFVTYRAWLPTIAEQLTLLLTTDDLSKIPGDLSPDNPLKYAAFIALSNSNGSGLYVGAVQNPASLNSWSQVLEVSSNFDDVYNLVPLSEDEEVQALFAAHVASSSGPVTQLWRAAWVTVPSAPEIPLVSAESNIRGHREAKTSDGLIAFGTFSDDPATAAVSFTLLQVPSNNAKFVSKGVRPGDTVRTLFQEAGNSTTYSEFIVDQVVNENTIKLVSGPSTAQSVPIKFEVWRSLSPSEEAEQIATYASTFNDRRIRVVYPDSAFVGPEKVSGVYIAAAAASLSSSVFPHQSLTRSEINGFSSLSERLRRFSFGDLDTLGSRGVWLVVQDRAGRIFNRHAVTSDTKSINFLEESVTRNLDSLSYRIRDLFAPFIGVTNVSGTSEIQLRGDLVKSLDDLANFVPSAGLGPQLVDYDIVTFERSATFLDRFIVKVNFTVPFANNGLDVYLTI
jgi:hypothetical protein